LALLGVMLAVAESKSEFVSIKNVLQWTVIVLSVLIVGAAVHDAIADWQNLRSFDSLRSFVIAPLLSLLFAPFVYGLLLYSTYENLFARLSRAARDDKGLRRQRPATLCTATPATRLLASSLSATSVLGPARPLPMVGTLKSRLRCDAERATPTGRGSGAAV
jgi:hypothetical protein